MKFYTILLLAQYSLQAQPKVVSVCDILANLQAYRNKIVSVRGELLRGDEGTWLRGECVKPLVTSGHAWPPAISLETPNSSSAENPDRPRSVFIDPASSELLSRNVRDENVRIWVTVVGRLETRTRFEMVLRGDGTTVPYGYGHLNSSPAQLIEHSIKDVMIEKPKKSPDGP